MRNSTKAGLYLASAIVAVLSAPAFAQDTATVDNKGVNEIIVTAQRKGESLLDVPLSIQATTGDQLASAGIKQMSDLQLTTPGFATSNASGYNQMFIRGIGNSIFVGADPSVATFIDEVPRVFGSMVNNFVDVERVEVIKGAPGALYGRNATGGAVNIITRQPDTDAVHATFRASYGEKNTFQASGYVNLPLSDQLAISLTGDRRSHDGYIKNITPNAGPIYTAAMFPPNPALGGASGIVGFGAGGAPILGTGAQMAALVNSGLSAKDSYSTEDFWAVGGKILFRPSDSFKITIAGDYSKKDDDNGNGLYNLTPQYAVAVASALFNANAGANTTPAGLAPIGNPLATAKFTTAQRGEGYVKLKDYGVSGTAVLNLGSVDITSITAYRENHSRFLTELGFLPFNFLAAKVDIDKSTFYQELRAASTGDGPLHWIVGGSYLQAKFDGGLATTIFKGIPYLANLPSGSGKYTVTNWSAYLQADYDITEKLNLMLSGRYINEKNDAISFNPIANTQDPFLLKEHPFLPAATLKYSFDGGGNVYARWARGFKSGGIVPVVPTSFFPDPINQGGAFRGEHVDTYEVGAHASLMDRKVQVSAAVFYNDYKDVQVAAHVSPTFPLAALVSISVVNAGSARTYGAEASVTARVAEPLTLNASVGYLNAKYKTFRIAPGNPVIAPFDLSNTRMINSPEWQLSFGADLDQPINDSFKVVGNVLASYTDAIIWQQSGLPGVLPDSVGPSYWLVNARFGVRTADDRYELAVYAKNLFNSAYTTFGNSSSTYGNILAWGDPRIVGVEGTVKF
ncbi:TonB-dependent receptor [Novosphingobium sp. G106]|uniref:TonB-dependent receptor n=1 Tax=Novosphingobium sp. G106 TaxID=2849500 RepID=UPI001C2CD865|nr:TonB-dependent receptor [Novosphingobium sp. G106]MBV1691675.1 TonB-dependent receptor [Novosphingobium sp. G106]